MTKFVYRSEHHIDRNGNRWLAIWRRDVIIDGDPAHLGGSERVMVPEGIKTSPNWQPCAGLAAMPCKVSRERMKACGYSAKPPKEIDL